MENPEVLIVGAGPTGLTAAGELGRLGVSVKIIDKNNCRSDKSKALGVQAGTLEALEASFGSAFTQKMVHAGNPAKLAFMHVYDRDPIKVDLSAIPSIFNYVLILPQSETEGILEASLNQFSVTVDRNTELISIKQTSEKVTSKLRGANGIETEIVSDFVIGADGAHSTVRHLLQIPFRGGSYPGNFILGDVELEWPWEHGTVRAFLSGKGFMASFPIDGQRFYRLVLAENRKHEPGDLDISLEEFSAIVSRLCPKEIKIRRAAWLSRFNVHHRITKTFQLGRVFLAGDAAHIHSPAGGQGMNTGIQDALNLSFKIAKVLRENAPVSLLVDYGKERLPVAKNIVWGTDLATRLGLIREYPISKLIRIWLVPVFLRSKWIQGLVVKAISQVKIARKEIQNRDRVS